MVQLDGLRGLAAIAVLIHHTMPIGITRRLCPGPAGVNLFFVLSGFLITGILLRARAEAHTARRGVGHVLLAFYARRFLRIFPLYYAVLLAAALLGLPVIAESLPWHFAYLSNYFIALKGYSPGPPVTHLWTLSVEEQFYLIWPALVLFTPRHRLPILFGVTVVTAPLCRATLMLLTGNDVSASAVTPSCLDTLGIGAVLALLWQGGEDARVYRGRLCQGGLWIGGGLLLLVTLHRILDQDSTSYHPKSIFTLIFTNTSHMMIFVWLVDRAATGFGGVGKAILEFRPLVYLGTISYGVYVLHNFVPPMVGWVDRHLGIWLHLPDDAGVLRLLYVSLATIPVAALSWHVFERPLNDLKGYFPYSAGRRASPVPASAADAASLGRVRPLPSGVPGGAASPRR
jgi:peptidoglycan/LPS O-acetylase OafA/YrhL